VQADLRNEHTAAPAHSIARADFSEPRVSELVPTHGPRAYSLLRRAPGRCTASLTDTADDGQDGPDSNLPASLVWFLDRLRGDCVPTS
jgi:hypothetical protein